MLSFDVIDVIFEIFFNTWKPRWRVETRTVFHLPVWGCYHTGVHILIVDLNKINTILRKYTLLMTLFLFFKFYNFFVYNFIFSFNFFFLFLQILFESVVMANFVPLVLDFVFQIWLFYRSYFNRSQRFWQKNLVIHFFQRIWNVKYVITFLLICSPCKLINMNIVLINVILNIDITLFIFPRGPVKNTVPALENQMFFILVKFKSVLVLRIYIGFLENYHYVIQTINFILR